MRIGSAGLGKTLADLVGNRRVNPQRLRANAVHLLQSVAMILGYQLYNEWYDAPTGQQKIVMDVLGDDTWDPSLLIGVLAVLLPVIARMRSVPVPAIPGVTPATLERMNASAPAQTRQIARRIARRIIDHARARERLQNVWTAAHSSAASQVAVLQNMYTDYLRKWCAIEKRRGEVPSKLGELSMLKRMFEKSRLDPAERQLVYVILADGLIESME